MRGHRFELVVVDDPAALSETQLNCLRAFAARAELCRAPDPAGASTKGVHEDGILRIAKRLRKGGGR